MIFTNLLNPNLKWFDILNPTNHYWKVTSLKLTEAQCWLAPGSHFSTWKKNNNVRRRHTHIKNETVWNHFQTIQSTCQTVVICHFSKVKDKEVSKFIHLALESSVFANILSKLRPRSQCCAKRCPKVTRENMQCIINSFYHNLKDKLGQ